MNRKKMIIANIQIKTMTAAPTIPARLSGSPLWALLAGSGDHLRRNERQSESDAGGDNDEVVEVAEDGDEIGNKVDGAEGVSDNQKNQGPGKPGSARVAGGKVQGIGLGLEEAGAGP